MHMLLSHFGRSNARTCFANPFIVRFSVPGLSILKDCLLEALLELVDRLQFQSTGIDLA